jgi:hypothetical protein
MCTASWSPTSIQTTLPLSTSNKVMASCVNRHNVDSAADFNNLATEVKGQALLRIIHHGEALFVVTPADQGDR